MIEKQDGWEERAHTFDEAFLFVPARRPPNGRSRAKAANLVKFALLALLVVVNGCGWIGVLALLLYHAEGRIAPGLH